jgi:hypothetical protein
VQLIQSPPLPQRLFPGTVQNRAVTPPWTTRDTVALAQTANGVSWTVSGKDGLLLSVYSADDVPILTQQLSAETWDDTRSELPMHARSEGVFVGLDDLLISLDANSRYASTRLSGRIIGLSGSVPHSRVRIAASYEEGGVILWKDTQRTRMFGHGLIAPRTTFLLTGNLVAVDELQIEVYGTGRNTLSFESSLASPGKPLSVMPVARNSFAVLCNDGRLMVYRLAE